MSPCPMNKAAGAVLLMLAAVEHFKTHGSMPDWAKR